MALTCRIQHHDQPPRVCGAVGSTPCPPPTGCKPSSPSLTSPTSTPPPSSGLSPEDVRRKGAARGSFRPAGARTWKRRGRPGDSIIGEFTLFLELTFLEPTEPAEHDNERKHKRKHKRKKRKRKRKRDETSTSRKEEPKPSRSRRSHHPPTRGPTQVQLQAQRRHSRLSKTSRCCLCSSWSGIVHS